jgi:hypothetical protein
MMHAKDRSRCRHSGHRLIALHTFEEIVGKPILARNDAFMSMFMFGVGRRTRAAQYQSAMLRPYKSAGYDSDVRLYNAGANG